MKWKATGFFAVAVMGTMALSGCGQENTGGTGDADSAPDGKPTVGLVMKSLGNQYFQAMQEGAKEFADEDGSFELKTVGTQSETDITGQVEAVNNLVTQGVDALVVAPADSRALVAPLIEAAAQGIEIVNIDVKLDDDALAEADLDIPFVGPDNVDGARQAGNALAQEIGEDGKVAIIEGIEGAANAEQRKEGFNDAVEEGGLELVESSSANWETDEANTLFANMLSAHPEIEGVMAANDSMALGVLSALESAGKLGDIKVVSFDNLPEVHPYLDSGDLLATVDQFGSEQAADGIRVALDMVNGEEPDEDWVKTDIKLITAKD